MPTFVVSQLFIERQHEEPNGTNAATRRVDFSGDGDTIKVCIVDAATATALDNTSVDDLGDVTGQTTGTGTNEVAATAGAYTPGPGNRFTITGFTVVLAANTVTIDHADMTITQNAGGFTDGRALVYFKENSAVNDASCQVIGWVIAAGDFGNQSGDLVIAPAGAAGIIGITES